jgi:dihydroorotase
MASRRQFVRTAALGFPALLLKAADYDLVIRGGRVLDPSQGLDRTFDVGVRGGKIAALGAKLAGAQEIDARGKLVVPGLIDIHVHARDAELPPGEFLSTGVTTMVDAGSRGADNVAQLIDVASKSPNRMRMMLNVARLGNNPNGRAEFLDSIEPADVEKARAAVQRHRQWIVGIKARLSRGISADRDLEVLRRAVRVAAPFKIPVMIHMGDTYSPLPQVLALLRKGDIVTHVYAPTPNGILDAQGIILPEVRAARARGVRFDFGNGLNEHWAWDVAEKAMRQGFAPDTITSDLNLPGRTDQVYDLPNVLSKFLVLGMPLEQVIACATRNAAATFREFHSLGSLRKDAVADVVVLEQAEGNFEFVDNYKNKRSGPRKLITRAVVAGGKHIS